LMMLVNGAPASRGIIIRYSNRAIHMHSVCLLDTVSFLINSRTEHALIRGLEDVLVLLGCI
jgi:hypothetical protein